MKRIVRLTEGDLHRIVKKSVNRILRESEIDGDKNFDDAGFVDSISKFCENPVDMNNYEPSDEDIYGALGEFNPDDLDTDFSDLMSYNQNESRRRYGRMLSEEEFIPDLQKYVSDSNFPQKRASKFQRVNKQGGKSFITQQAKAAGQNDPRKIGRMIRKGKGMPLRTYASDGTLETNKLITKDDVVLNNVGNPDNRWSPDIQTFLKKYEPTMVGNIYKPKGGPMYAYGPIQQDISFTSPWGTTEHVKAGGYILQDPKKPSDIYGISREDFDASYRFDESRRRLSKIVREAIDKVLGEDDEDNINLNDRNSGESIRRRYGGNEWGSSSAMENPFTRRY